MCGIAGIISVNEAVTPSLIQGMTDIISYRGPDDYGYFAFNSDSGMGYPYKDHCTMDQPYNLFFGHRRLSIIDLSEAGHQPFSYLNQRYWITFNGEIYNYVEIKNELISKGYMFRSNTDTEVILASYHEWGVECLQKFNGMWSFAILDTVKKNVFCARDRLGIKPFYYSFTQERLYFCSEIKQILTIPGFEVKIDYDSITDFFFWEHYNTLGKKTYFENISALNGGHYFELDLTSGPIVIEPKKYWDINLKNKISGLTDSQYADRYLELFYNSVELRLRSDVAVGSALSGGLDSSGIVCTVDKILKSKGIHGIQKTFTSMSDQAQFDETDFANEVIRNTNVQPFYTLPDGDKLMLDYKKLIWHQEDLFISTSIFAGWCVSRLVKESGVTVSLDGQGPDEMLGGYYPYQAILAQNLSEHDFAEFFNNKKHYAGSLNLSDPFIYRKILSAFFHQYVPASLFPSFSEKSALFNKDKFEGLIKPCISTKIDRTVSTMRYPFDQYSYDATRLAPLPGILRQVDRNSMAFSIESRLPFLDYRLVEYTFSLPLNQKVRSGQTKFVYRNAMKGILPDRIRNRTSKLGFVTAEPHWFKSALKAKMYEAFNSLDNNSIINKTTIIKRFDDFIANPSHFNPVFWKVFNFIIWKEAFNIQE
ncbi:MAG: asparagine synthase (glutamine-hydrolyzing) [Bacteroidota bacterium]